MPLTDTAELLEKFPRETCAIVWEKHEAILPIL